MVAILCLNAGCFLNSETQKAACTSSNHTLQDDFFDFADGACGVQVFRTRVHTVHDGVAAEQAVWVVQVVQTFVGDGVAGVGDEAVGIQEAGWANEFVGVPPEGWAGGRAAGAEDAFIQAVQLGALGLALQAFLLRVDRVVIDHIGFDGVILLEELGHVHDEVADDG